MTEKKTRLVLTRTPQQSIEIAGPCRVTVVRVDGQSVRLAIEAAPTTRVLRAELLELGEVA